MVLSARDRFPEPTRSVNELWQTDFTYLKVVRWGWYFPSTVLDDYSHYILLWQLCSSMTADDVKATVEDAKRFIGVIGARKVLARRETIRNRTMNEHRRLYIEALAAGT
jgi:transposase InsO family protein